MPSLLLVVLIVLAAISAGTLALVPAWLLWRMKHQWQFPLIWLVVVVVLLGLATVLTTTQVRSLPMPVPINETLHDVTDPSGNFTVTGLRLADSTVRDALIEVDVENSGSTPVPLGLQYVADGGSLGNEAYATGTTEGAFIQRVQPDWNGTVAFHPTLPPFVFGGNIVIVLAVCPDVELDPGATALPPDSQALYQNHFELVPEPEALQQQDPGSNRTD